MAKKTKPKKKKQPSRSTILIVAISILVIIFILFRILPRKQNTISSKNQSEKETVQEIKHFDNQWLERAYLVGELFHQVYTPCWEGAYGAIGDAYLFRATNDSSLLRFHLQEHDLRKMCEGTWVDDRAWVCLAELYWWDFSGKKNSWLIEDAKFRYLQARNEGRLSSHDGYWSWYNYSPNLNANIQIFTNSNMNQMMNVACLLFEATKEKQFLDDALLVWNGGGKIPGIKQTLYKGNGIWEGRRGAAAFGKEIPWGGVEYCSILSSLYRITKDNELKKIIISTAERMMNPKNGWVDSDYFFQINMDGNGAFVNYLLDAYSIAPDELADILPKIEKMLEHVWTNHNGTSKYILHRDIDNGIRNGWNPNGGEDGYNVNEIGTVHAQGEAMRAFGTFAYYSNKKE